MAVTCRCSRFYASLSLSLSLLRYLLLGPSHRYRYPLLRTDGATGICCKLLLISLQRCILRFTVLSRAPTNKSFIFSPHSSTALVGLGPVKVRFPNLIQLDTPQSTGLLRTRDRPVAETSIRQHATLTRDSHARPQRDSKP